jgi:hypothetical protein
MARYDYLVDCNGFLDDVQSISITRGRVQIQDPFKAGTAVVTGRNIAALPTINIGDEIFINATRTGMSPVEVFAGVIADVKITYGQVSAMDTWELHCEDVLARIGRSLTSGSFSWSAGLRTSAAAFKLLVESTDGAASLFVDPLFPGSSFVSAQSIYNTNVLQILNELAFTEQAFLAPSSPTSLVFVSRSQLNGFYFFLIGDFSDGTLSTPNPTAQFSEVVFRSQADSFVERVTVEPEGLASQTAGTGGRNYGFKSFDQTTAQAGNLANYVLATLQVQESVPSTISAISEVQTNDVALDLFAASGAGARCDLILRGEKYNLFVLGGTLTATPEQTRWSYNIVSSEAYSFFILDAADFGVLDQNRLGF